MDKLGALGMSSDEEVDSPDGSKSKEFRIRRPAWRNKSLDVPLRTIDAVHRICFSLREDGRGTSGRSRTCEGPPSARTKVVHKLPRGAYDADWLAAKTPEEVEWMVAPDDKVTFDLAIPDAINK